MKRKVQKNTWKQIWRTMLEDLPHIYIYKGMWTHNIDNVWSYMIPHLYGCS